MPGPQNDVIELMEEEDEVASDDARMNRDLFKDQHGFPIGFFLHKSIKKGFSRRNLSRDIKRHGGIVLDTDIGCDTVLVDVMYDQKDALQISYNTDDDPRLRKVYVESTPFVQRCIQYNHFVHRIPPLRGMGGSIGRVRVPFTAHDDEALCYYIARVLPDKAAGGRLGLEIYKKLVKTAAVKDTHAWGARHTAESWKERYKKNAIKFDQWIEDIVKQEGRSRKQLWPEDRRASQKALLGKYRFEPEEEEEDSSEEERSQLPRKRPRADYLSPPLVRRRVVQRSSDQQVRTHPNGGRKGKARAVEEEEEENEEDADQLNQLRDQVGQNQISEPGPSGSRRFLETTNVATDVLTHRTQPNTASFFTQETIVATPPNVQSKEVSHSPVEGGSSSFGRSIASPRHEPLVVIDLTSQSESVGRSSPAISLSLTRTLVNPSQTQAPQPSIYQRPLRAARRPRAMIEGSAVDAPYRNTRSRLLSVEPYTSKSPVRGSKKKRNQGARKTIPVLATFDEIQDDDRQVNENLEAVDKSESESPPLGETIAEEVDIEKMLISKPDEGPDEADEVRGVSLDTDDAQTEQNLRPTQPPRQALSSLHRRPSDILREFQESSAIWNRSSLPLITRPNPFNRPAVPVVGNTQQALSSLHRHPSDILKEFQESSPIWNRSSLPLMARPNLFNRPAGPVGNTQQKPNSVSPPSPTRNIPDTYRLAEPPRTPLSRSRKNSVSSTDSFPVSGTRASALKKTIQQQEKRSPYQPPPGTRAAKLARSGR